MPRANSIRRPLQFFSFFTYDLGVYVSGGGCHIDNNHIEKLDNKITDGNNHVKQAIQRHGETKIDTQGCVDKRPNI